MTTSGTTRRDRAVPVSAGLLVVEILLVALTLAVRTQVAVVQRIDSSIDTALNSAVWRAPDIVTSWRVVSLVGGPVVWDVLGAVVAVVLWTKRHRRYAVTIVVALAGAAALSNVIKVLIGRSRPQLAHAVAHAGGKSFPSGHALTSFVAVGLIVLFIAPRLGESRRAWLTAGGAVVVVLVGVSRLVLGVHYLSDVVAAWLVGTLWLAAIAFVTRTDRI